MLVPFAVLSKTAFIAERPLGWVVGSGVRLMVLTLVLGVGNNIFQSLKVPAGQTVTTYQAFCIALAALLLMVLSLVASRLATDMIIGGPSLGVGTAINTTAVAVNTTAAAADSTARRDGREDGGGGADQRRDADRVGGNGGYPKDHAAAVAKRRKSGSGTVASAVSGFNCNQVRRRPAPRMRPVACLGQTVLQAERAGLQTKEGLQHEFSQHDNELRHERRIG